MTSPPPRIPWRELAPTVLLPNLLEGISQGATLPVFPVAALELGASYSTAALVASMFTIGQLLVALPAGWFLNRFGEKTTMVASCSATSIACVGAFAAPDLLVLGTCVLVIGVGIQTLSMARHAWITVSMPVALRGRTLSVVAGSTRLGMLFGPFMAAGALALSDHATNAFVAAAGTSVLAVVAVSLSSYPSDPSDPVGGRSPRVLETMWLKREILVRLGLTTSIVSTLRATRQILVPLVGLAVGLDEVTVAVVVGFAAGVDVALFYLGGLIVDKMGRLWVAVPALIGFGICHIVLGLADRLPGGTAWYVGAAMVMSIGNGMSSGLVNTMGSDLADRRRPASFLSAWRLVVEIGPGAAPFAVSLITASASLGVACISLGGIGLLGAVLLPQYVHKYLPETAKVTIEGRPPPHGQDETVSDHDDLGMTDRAPHPPSPNLAG